jgi:Uma2 family endonuclease
MTLTLVESFAEETQAVLAPLNVEQYHRMIEQGVLPEGAPIELIDGLLVRKDRRDSQGDIMTVGPRHASVLTRLTRLLTKRLPETAGHVRTQQPVALTGAAGLNEPEPDLSIAAGNEESYAGRHPGPRDLSLVIEVADSSLSLDCGRKLVLYREAGIPEYWVVNLRDDVVEVFRDPDAAEWREHEQLSRGQTLQAKVGDAAVTVEVDEILGPPEA